ALSEEWRQPRELPRRFQSKRCRPIDRSLPVRLELEPGPGRDTTGEVERPALAARLGLDGARAERRERSWEPDVPRGEPHVRLRPQRIAQVAARVRVGVEARADAALEPRDRLERGARDVAHAHRDVVTLRMRRN